MKKRSCFVSNSSSSSFVVVGAKLEIKKVNMKDFINDHFNHLDIDRICRRDYNTAWDSMYNWDDNMMDLFYGTIRDEKFDNEFELMVDDEDGQMYVGYVGESDDEYFETKTIETDNEKLVQLRKDLPDAIHGTHMGTRAC